MKKAMVKIDTLNVYYPPPAEGGLQIFPRLSSTLNAEGVPEAGQLWPEQGGVLAGIMPAQENHPAYYLIIPTEPEAEAGDIAWGEYGKDIKGLSSWDGKANTDRLSKLEEKLPAPDFCNGLKIGKFNDFYLPSRREASLMAATVPHLFEPGWHWTSTQYSAHGAFFQDFGGGFQYGSHKGCTLRVRAVRRFIIN